MFKMVKTVVDDEAWQKAECSDCLEIVLYLKDFLKTFSGQIQKKNMVISLEV